MKVRIQAADNGYIVTELEGDKNTYVYHTWDEVSRNVFDWLPDMIAEAKGHTIDLSVTREDTNK